MATHQEKENQAWLNVQRLRLKAGQAQYTYLKTLKEFTDTYGGQAYRKALEEFKEAGGNAQCP